MQNLEDALMDKKIIYLQMIQEPICRMSTISAILKGFTVTIVGGISLVSFSKINWIILLLSFLPVISFAILDIYYLTLERKYRFLYEQVRNNKHDVDFSMNLTKESAEIVEAKAGIWDCIKSPSIYLFYPMMIVILILVLYIKYNSSMIGIN